MDSFVTGMLQNDDVVRRQHHCATETQFFRHAAVIEREQVGRVPGECAPGRLTNPVGEF